MKESKAVYVTKRDFNADAIVAINREYQFYVNKVVRDGVYLPEPARYGEKTLEVGCQYDCKRDNLMCTCKYLAAPRRKQEIRYFGSPKHIYSYQGSRSFTDIGVGSVKTLQRKKVKRIYLPETNDRGVGNSDLPSYVLQRTKQQNKPHNKSTSSKCVGGILEYNIGFVINEKLSPIVQTISGSTSYTEFNFNTNIEIGNSAILRSIANTTTQVENLITRDVEIEAEVEQKITKDIEIEVESEADIEQIEQVEQIVQPTIMTQEDPEEMNAIAVDSRKPAKPEDKPTEGVSSDSLRHPTIPKEKPTDRVSSSDSLLQHVHNLENPSIERNSRMSLEAEDLMENKLELEYRNIFSAKSKSKESKHSAHNSVLKSTSTLRRRFQALRRGLAKKDDSKMVIVKKESSQVSTHSRKDVSINSDPPSLEGRSFSNMEPYTPFTTRYSRDRSMHNLRASHYRRPVTDKKERGRAEWSSKGGDDDSETHGVKGMFKLWGKKFNLEEGNYNNRQCTPKPSYNPTRKEEIQKVEVVPILQEPPPPIKPDPVPEPEPEPGPDEKKEGRRFFLFKNKKKNKEKEIEKEKKPFKTKKGVTAGLCEVRDGLVIKILGDNIYKPEDIRKEPEICHNHTPDDYEEMVRKSWLKKFITPTIDSRNSVKVRWNNKTYAPSSSTVFELIDNIYKDTSSDFRSKSQVTVQSSYRSHTRQHVNFMQQNIEAWMIPKTFTDRPMLLPVKQIQKQLTCKSDEDTKDNMEVRISDQKWFIDKSKAFSHKIEVVLHSENFKKLYKEESSEYLRIDIPKGFFMDSSNDEVTKLPANQSSDEEVFKIVEYETGSDLKKDKGTRNISVGDHKQNKIKVTVSVKESTKCVSKVLETPSKPTSRDVVVQGSHVFIPRKCDVVGVGIITHRDLSQIRKPILTIQDDFSDEESEHNLLRPNTKQCEFEESYLQDYYRHWTPLGIDLFSWCASDSQLKCCSEHSRSSFQNQGDITKSCPNIFEDFHTATIISSCDASSFNLQYKPQNVSDFPEKGNKKKNKTKEKKIDSCKRVLPKDSIEVFKRRKIYATSNRSKWLSCNTDWAKPPRAPCFESESDEESLKKSRGKSKEQPNTKKRPYKKHVSLPDYDTINNDTAKQLASVPESILAFKGTNGCDVCKRKEFCSKHATMDPKPPCEIPPAPCKNPCEHMKKPSSTSPKRSCEKLPKDCDTMNNVIVKQLASSMPESILVFKGTNGCDVCKRKEVCGKQAKVIPQPSCETPRAPCRNTCEHMKKPPCASSKQSCETLPQDCDTMNNGTNGCDVCKRKEFCSKHSIVIPQPSCETPRAPCRGSCEHMKKPPCASSKQACASSKQACASSKQACKKLPQDCDTNVIVKQLASSVPESILVFKGTNGCDVCNRKEVCGKQAKVIPQSSCEIARAPCRSPCEHMKKPPCASTKQSCEKLPQDCDTMNNGTNGCDVCKRKEFCSKHSIVIPQHPCEIPRSPCRSSCEHMKKPPCASSKQSCKKLPQDCDTMIVKQLASSVPESILAFKATDGCDCDICIRKEFSSKQVTVIPQPSCETPRAPCRDQCDHKKKPPCVSSKQSYEKLPHDCNTMNNGTNGCDVCKRKEFCSKHATVIPQQPCEIPRAPCRGTCEHMKKPPCASSKQACKKLPQECDTMNNVIVKQLASSVPESILAFKATDGCDVCNRKEVCGKQATVISQPSCEIPRAPCRGSCEHMKKPPCASSKQSCEKLPQDCDTRKNVIAKKLASSMPESILAFKGTNGCDVCNKKEVCSKQATVISQPSCEIPRAPCRGSCEHMKKPPCASSKQPCASSKQACASSKQACKKLPQDCDTVNNVIVKQLASSVPESILAFKATEGCDVCKRKEVCGKQAIVIPQPSCEIPRAPCRGSCEHMKKPPCASSKQSCEKLPQDCDTMKIVIAKKLASSMPESIMAFKGTNGCDVCNRKEVCSKQAKVISQPSCEIPRAPCRGSCEHMKKQPCASSKQACASSKQACASSKQACKKLPQDCDTVNNVIVKQLASSVPESILALKATDGCDVCKRKEFCSKHATVIPQSSCEIPRAPCRGSCEHIKKPPCASSKHSCEKLPQDCDNMNHEIAKQLASAVPESMLAFKGANGCDVCKRKEFCSKHSTVIPQPSCCPPPHYPSPPCYSIPSPLPTYAHTPPCYSTSSPLPTYPHTSPCKPPLNPSPTVPCKSNLRWPTPPTPPKPCACTPQSPPSPRKGTCLSSPLPCPPQKPSCPCGPPPPRMPPMNKKQCPPFPPCGNQKTKNPPTAPPSCRTAPPQCFTDLDLCPSSPPPCQKSSSKLYKLFKKKQKSNTTCPSSPSCKPKSCQSSFCRSLACQQSLTSVSYRVLRPDAPLYYSPIHPCTGIVPEPKIKKSVTCHASPCHLDDEFPWPTKNQVSNQPSNTSLCQNSQESHGKCMKDSPMFPKMLCETVPSVKNCNPSYPNCGGSPRLPCLSKILGMQCSPPRHPCLSPPAEPLPVPCPPPIPSKSKPKVSGIFLKMMPAPKKSTCSKDCLAWENGQRDGSISFNSKEKITIRLKKQTASTGEIREGLNIKVQDEDGMTLFERKDYSLQHTDGSKQRQPSLLGEMYKASEVHRVTTNDSTQDNGTHKETRKEIEEVASDTSIANLIEIQFKLKVTHGEKTTEINIANDGDKDLENIERKEPIKITTPEVYVVKNEDESSAEHSDQKNDINIRIVIKNFKSKSGKKKSINVKQDDYYDFSKKISAKLHTVSTGYSDVFHDDHVFSVHRATVDLTSSVENTRMDATTMHNYKTDHSIKIINEPTKRGILIGSSEASVCRCITTEDEKSEDTDAKSFPSLRYSNTKEIQENAEETDTQVTDHKYEYNEDTDTEKPIKYDTEETDTDRQVDHPKYDTETDTERKQDKKFDTFMSTSDTDEPDTLPEIRKSHSLDVIVKPQTKEEKKEILKQVMEKVHDTKFKNKTRMRKLRDMLKVKLTSDSSVNDDTKLKVPTNDLAKDVTYASLKPNYFRDTDSMHNYYKLESKAVLSDAEINRQVVYPSAENNSDCSNSVCSVYVVSSDNVDSTKRGGCMCSTVAARLKLASRIGEVRGCCCASKQTNKKDEETICDWKRESDYHMQIDYKTTEFEDVHTQNSRYLTSKLNSTNLSAHSSIKASKGSSFNFEGLRVGSGVLNVDSRQFGLINTISPERVHLRDCEIRKRNRNAILNISDDEKIVLSSGHSTRLPPGNIKARDEKQEPKTHAADILQSYEAKKAVLEIYTEKTISDDGEHLVAKLPKFVYDREQEIHANYEAMAKNTYKTVCKKNIIMMAIKK